MKKILIILLSSLFLASCATIEFRERTTYYYSLDLKSYSEQGFNFYFSTPTVDYESIGILRVRTYPQISVLETGDDSLEKKGWTRLQADRSNTGSTKVSWIEPPDYDFIYEQFFYRGKEMGGNAAMKIDIKEIKLANREIVDYYEISGYIIKTK